jgi:hypothetical protein
MILTSGDESDQESWVQKKFQFKLQKISKVSEFHKDGFFIGRIDVHLFFWQLELFLFFFFVCS